MGNNRGKLTLGVGIEEQATIDANDATGRSKRVERRTVDDDKRQPVVLQVAVYRQVVGKIDQIVVEQGVGDGRCAAAHRAQKLTPHPVFFLQ